MVGFSKVFSVLPRVQSFHLFVHGFEVDKTVICVWNDGILGVVWMNRIYGSRNGFYVIRIQGLDVELSLDRQYVAFIIQPSFGDVLLVQRLPEYHVPSDVLIFFDSFGCLFVRYKRCMSFEQCF